MLKMYKDLRFSYFLIVIVSVLTVFAVAEESFSIVAIYFFLVFWVLCFSVFFNVAAKKRYTKALKSAVDNCMIEESLNRLYGIYKGRPYSKTDLIVAESISDCLLHLGKNQAALDILSAYNAEALFASSRFFTYKYLYYQTLAVCYSRLGRKEEAKNAFNRSDELFGSPYVNGKLKLLYKNAHEANRLIITGDESDYETVLYLLNKALEENGPLLNKVSCRYSMAVILIKAGRAEEAKAHIDFIALNGGDTVYRKAALENKLPYEPDGETEEPFTPRPVKPKTAKTYILSVALAALMIGGAVLFGFMNVKTAYEYDDMDKAVRVTQTFNKSGNIVYYKMERHDYYPGMDPDHGYELYVDYQALNAYKGCKVSLSEKDGAIDFELTVDCKKASDSVYAVLGIYKTEEEFLSAPRSEETSVVTRYKKYTFVTVFDGVAE